MATRAKVNPRTSNPTHTISLSDGVQNWGLRLEGDYKYIQETPQTPSTLMINRAGGEYGDFDPSMSHIQQSEWIGGRGSERFVEDQTRFFDSKNMWTISSGMILPTLQWHYSIGAHVSQNMLQLARNYNWKSLANNTYTVQFTPAATYTATKINLWIKKIGSPGTLTVAIYSDSADKPNAVVTSTTITRNSLFDENVHFYEFTVSTSLTGSTKYHLVVYGPSTDTVQNHWEVMCVNYDGNPLAYTSSDRVTYTTSTYKMYHKISATPTNVGYKFFTFLDNLYAVQLYPTGTETSKLFKLTPTENTFGGNVHTDFVTTEEGSTGLASVSDVLVINNIAYFAQGESTAMRRWNGTTWAADSTNKAAILMDYSVGADGIKIYRASGTGTIDVSSSVVKDWGTDLVFGSALNIKSGSTITNLIGYAGMIYILKTDSIWTYTLNADSKSTITKLNSQIDDAYNTTNGRAAVEHGQYLYFTLDKSVEQLYATTITDVGPGKGSGLPGNRSGYVSNFESVFNKLFLSIDAGSGYSSILMYDGVNYHELWQAPESGKSINHLFWYSSKNLDYPYLFFDYGGSICFMKFPDFGFNPIRDANIYYSPEAHIVSSTIDMNVVRLPKIFKELSLITKNLYNYKTDFELSNTITDDSKIEVDVQVDNDIDSDNWYHISTIYDSPFGGVSINKSNVYAMRFRLRVSVSDSNKPPVINATVVEGLARTPIKYQWVFRIKTSSMQSTLNGAPDHNPDKLLAWIKEKAASAEIVTMHSSLKALDLKQVLVEPPSVMREYVDPVQKSWGGVITVVLREA